MFSDLGSPRLNYVLKFVFTARGIPYELKSVNEYTPEYEYSLIYGEDLGGVYCINPSGLLSETGVKMHELESGPKEGLNRLMIDGVSDPLAAIFYVLTRYEEYVLDSKKDEHGRFPCKESILYKYGWLNKAICDQWAVEILSHIGYPLELINRQVTIVPSFDIDNTYAYKLKSGTRRLLSIARDLVKQDRNRLKERKTVENGGDDPYDTFDFIQQIAGVHKETKVFWLVGDLGPNDRNISIDIPEHSALIQKLDNGADVGLHPSYNSNSELIIIEKERKHLESILGHSVKNSRQHFLRLALPKTYRSLLQAEIMHDYSMGFAEQAGFRSGTARPHHWFDLVNNKEEALVIHPFVYMDGTLNEYNKLTPNEAISQIAELYQEVKKYGGDFVFIWHNETIGEYGKWKGWSKVLEFTLKLDNEL